MPTTYKASSYAEILLWLENTEIHYVPHGKKAGTKSYDRYEKYSQAKIVAEALEFGSKPVDLLNDYEKGLLKRVGGPIRDKPLNLAAVADQSTLSKTDLILGRWGYKANNPESGDGSCKEKTAQLKKVYTSAQREKKGLTGLLAEKMEKMKAKSALAPKVTTDGDAPAVLSAPSSETPFATPSTTPSATPSAKPVSTLAPNSMLAKVLAARRARAEKAETGVRVAPQATPQAAPQPPTTGAWQVATATAQVLPVAVRRKPGSKPLVRGGLLGRIQKRGADEPNEAAPMDDEQPVPSAASNVGMDTAESAREPPRVEVASARNEVSEHEAAMKRSPLATMVKMQVEEKKPVAVAAPAPKRKIGKPLAFGGLLARVQKRILPQESVERAASPAKSNAAPVEQDTTPLPARKRPRVGEAETEAMALSSAKASKPALAARIAEAAQKDAVDKVPSEEQKGTLVQVSSFLTCANACCLEGDHSISVLSDHLVEVVKSGGEEELELVASLLLPAKAVPANLLAKALSEAFTIPSVLSFRSEALAAAALDGRYRQSGLRAEPFTAKEVVDTMSRVHEAATDASAIDAMASLFRKTQTGLEPFFLTLALQGKLAPGEEVVRSALAKARASVAPVEPTDPVTPAAHVENAEPATSAAVPMETTEPATPAAVPTETTELLTCAAPMEATETLTPAVPMDTVEPLIPAAAMESAEPLTAAAAPVEATEPLAPAAPVEPAEPLAPAAAVEPTESLMPVVTMETTEAPTPAAPIEPAVA